jgi:predicted transposase YdaD
LAKPFDAITRTLLRAHPDDWLALFGLGRGLPVRVVDSDLSTITAEADKVLQVDGPAPCLIHVEVQSSYDPSLPRRLFRYNALLDLRHELPVHSVAVLLWRDADGPAIDGVLRRENRFRPDPIVFPYQVVRVWEQPVDELAASSGTFPLVALAARSEEELRRVATPILAALHDPANQDERELKAAFYFLVGRQFTEKLAEELFQGDRAMRESVTYQAVLDEGWRKGRVDEVRDLVLRQGTKQFGSPGEAVETRLMAETDRERLEELFDRLFSATGWDELLDGP